MVPPTVGLRNGFYYRCVLRFFTAPRLDLNPNLVLEMGSSGKTVTATAFCREYNSLDTPNPLS